MLANKSTMKIITPMQAMALMGLTGRATATGIMRHQSKFKQFDIAVVADTPCGPEECYDADNVVITSEVVYRKVISLTPEEIATRDRELFLENRAVIVQAIKVTTAAGNTFDGCEVSRGRMGDAVTGLDDVQTIRWVLADGSNIQATRAELKEALYLVGRAEEAVWVEE
jgi:hypothetical protein